MKFTLMKFTLSKNPLYIFLDFKKLLPHGDASAAALECANQILVDFFPDKPRFQEATESGEKVFTVVEGGNLIINLTATANPPEIEYKWTKNGNGGSRIPKLSEALPESR